MREILEEEKPGYLATLSRVQTFDPVSFQVMLGWFGVTKIRLWNEQMLLYLTLRRVMMIMMSLSLMTIPPVPPMTVLSHDSGTEHS